MGRNKKTDAQRRAEKFGELYRVGKARTRLQEPDIAALLGICEKSLNLHRKDPLNYFSVLDMDILATAFSWTNEEFLSVARGNRNHA